MSTCYKIRPKCQQNKFYPFILYLVSYTSVFQCEGYNIIRLTHTNVWRSMGKPCSCMQFIEAALFGKLLDNLYQYYKSCENLYQVLQFTQESVLQVTCATFERPMTVKVHMTHRTNLCQKIVCCCWHCYSCTIGLYYGNTYIVLHTEVELTIINIIIIIIIIYNTPILGVVKIHNTI